MPAAERNDLAQRYQAVRAQTERLCQPLAPDDYQIQSILETSPPKWHIAHVSWFFEAFVLGEFMPGYRPFHEKFSYLFNSYYQTVGQMQPRPDRGLLSRPTVDEVYAYRRHIDAAMLELLHTDTGEQRREIEFRTILGLHHEQQHQELLLMDIKHNFWVNPLRPVYQNHGVAAAKDRTPLDWLTVDVDSTEIGHGGDGFSFDNETPRHRAMLRPYRIANQLVTNAEFLAFMEAGGYERPELWLADGWHLHQKQGARCPLYWERRDGQWHEFTLSGMQKLNLSQPVCHVSFYEANAFANWKGLRLPTEAELEHVLQRRSLDGNFVESLTLHPVESAEGNTWFGNAWQWTQSAYQPYPGFRPLEGSMGEYNGKFMCNQMVLKGGCALTPRAHVRASYRNFYYPRDRWPMTGIRLAQYV